MTEPSRRPILHLKLGTVVRPLGPAAEAPAPKPAPKPSYRPSFKPPPPPAAHSWKCRPCGAGFTPPAGAADDEAVRCPSCNAKLGLAGTFRQDPPNLERLRARPAKR